LAPILKWAGGKRGLLYEIKALFPTDYCARVYHEPFFGGGAVFFNIQPKSGTINDINEELMNFYKVVRDEPEQLIELTKTYKHDKDNFYDLRKRYNQKGLSKIESASLLLYLNKTAFNGLYRVNSKGEFNVPFGSYRNPTIVPEDRIRKASALLQKIQIFCQDFTYILDQTQEGDLIYFDPPYQPLNSTSNFTSYSLNGFNYKDQIRLRDTCQKLSEKGVYFVLSNSFSSEIIDLYRDIPSFNIEVVKARRIISSKLSTRGGIYEILVTNITENISKGDSIIQNRFKRHKKESNFNKNIENQIFKTGSY
jgi:DNA adenine methylase